MPIHKSQFIGDSIHQKLSTADDLAQMVEWSPLLVLVFLFYVVSCSMERIFQSSIFTFGLCGPLLLDPRHALMADNAYSGGFMGGRVLGTALATFVRPRNLVAVSLIVNVVAASLLIGWWLESDNFQLLPFLTGTLQIIIQFKSERQAQSTDWQEPSV